MQQKRIKAKKSLGQHFLHDRPTIQRIVDALDLKANDTILEIGCGSGALTRQLAGRARQYVGVELDAELSRQLEQTMASPGVVFLQLDILTLNWQTLQAKYLLPGHRLKVVGNLPYNISSPIVRQLARNSDVLETAVVMLQAEVADRLMALPCSKDYGVLTLLSRYYFDCEFLLRVGPRAFRPPPKVTSKVVRLTPKRARPLLSSQETSFLDFVKRCFSQRRKTLRNCLMGFREIDTRRLETLLNTRGYPSGVRAEGLSLDDFIALYSALSD